MIRLTEVRLDEEAERKVLEVLRSGHLAQGPMVAAFESGFAAVAGTAHAVATTSGTSALVACVQALDLGPGDEIITTPFTFVATINAVLEAGASVRLVDILPGDFTIDPDRVAAALTPRTRAVIPVHLYGYPADMGRLAPLAADAGVAIIEDAAQAHGARVGGRPVGSWGLGVFSFYATKNMTTGEGGMVTTDDDALADRLRLLRNQGMRARYQYEIAGHNYRMTDLQAAIGLAQLAHLEEWTNRRRANAALLTEALRGTDGIDLPGEADDRHHVYHQYTIRVRDDAPLGRDALAARLRELGVETGIYYPHVAHDYDCFRDHPLVHAEPVPHAHEAADRVLSLPVHQWLVPAHVEQVAESVRTALAGDSGRRAS
jgi:dTDP-4-amino-4,6-dideoxygalactose transaminase